MLDLLTPSQLAAAFAARADEVEKVTLYTMPVWGHPSKIKAYAENRYLAAGITDTREVSPA